MKRWDRCASEWNGFLAFGLLAVASWLGSPQVSGVRAAETPPKKPLPPLVVESDSPLLLKDDKTGAGQEMSAAAARNAACYVCHANFSEEPLVQWHADGDVGCADCHGQSYAHRNDENNTTPPDVMFPRDKIEASCQECHDTHDVPAAEVVARLQQRVPRVSQGQQVVCTQCHGHHRLDHRTVVWDRATRKLLTGSDASPAEVARPSLATLRNLAGTWVEVGADGTPSDKIISTFRVTAAGSAVIEVLFPGQEHEMVTVYHQDGEALLLTHYCAAQNQPRLKCVPGDDPRLLKFEFVDATNMHSIEDHHMHAASIRIVGPNHIQSAWQGYDKGKPAGLVRFDLMRKR